MEEVELLISTSFVLLECFAHELMNNRDVIQVYWYIDFSDLIFTKSIKACFAKHCSNTVSGNACRDMT